MAFSVSVIRLSQYFLSGFFVLCCSPRSRVSSSSFVKMMFVRFAVRL